MTKKVVQQKSGNQNQAARAPSQGGKPNGNQGGQQGHKDGKSAQNGNRNQNRPQERRGGPAGNGSQPQKGRDSNSSGNSKQVGSGRSGQPDHRAIGKITKRPIKKGGFKGGNNDRVSANNKNQNGGQQSGKKDFKSLKGKLVLNNKLQQRGDRPQNGQLVKKGGKFMRKGGKKPVVAKKDRGQKKDKSMTLEDLDKDIESYWLKGGNKEMVTARLDKELDNYFAAQDESGAKNEAETKAEGAAAQQNPESEVKA